MSATIRAAAALALLLGSASAALAAHNNGKATYHVRGMERAAPPRFESRGVEVAPLPNWGFGCDPDYGPNGYNPCTGPNP